METVDSQRYTPAERRSLEALAELGQQAERLKRFIDEALPRIAPPLPPAA
jgi:hypothetical protein